MWVNKNVTNTIFLYFNCLEIVYQRLIFWSRCLLIPFNLRYVLVSRWSLYIMGFQIVSFNYTKAQQVLLKVCVCVCVCVCVSVSLCVSSSVCVSLYLCFCFRMCLSVCLCVFVCLFKNVSVCLCLSVCVTVSFCLYVCDGGGYVNGQNKDFCVLLTLSWWKLLNFKRPCYTQALSAICGTKKIK